MKAVPIIIGFLIFAVIIYMLMPKPTLSKNCPAGYYYAPWASSGTECIPIGIASSEAGVSTDATRPGVYSTLMTPA